MAEEESWPSLAERREREMAAGKARLRFHHEAAEQAKALGNMVNPETMAEIAAMNAKEDARRQEETARKIKTGEVEVVVDGKDGGWPMPTVANPEAAQEAYERAVKEQQNVSPGIHKQDAVLVPPATSRSRKVGSLVDKLLDEK